ncbi:hypothetical protein STEG23_030393 [Scotinomys teguina]
MTPFMGPIKYTISLELSWWATVPTFQVKKMFQKANNDKKQLLRLPASENSIQKVLKTEIQGISAMQVADALREHVPLDFKDIKQLKEAVLAYGTHAPFTLAIFESFTALHCAPCDWQQLCRAALSGGDYLLWRSEFQELCQQIANQNAAAGFPGRNLDMLIGAGQYANLAAQIRYDPTVYAQISAAAMRAWKALPNKASGEQLSKVIQGPSEPFSEFVDHLLQLAGKIFGNADQAMPIVKQLAFENG